MFTVGRLAKRLGMDIGVFSFNSSETNARNERGLADGDMDAIVDCINEAVQIMWDKAPSHLSERPKGFAIRPATAIVATVSQYSNTVAFTSGFASWMIGCTVSLSGDGVYNEIVSATELLRPYMGIGTTGVDGTVWCDAIPLDSTIKTVVDPVYIPDRQPLTFAKDRKQFLYDFFNHSHFGGSHSHYPPGYAEQASAQNNKITGDPRVYMVESIYAPNGTTYDTVVVSGTGIPEIDQAFHVTTQEYGDGFLYLNEDGDTCLVFSTNWIFYPYDGEIPDTSDGPYFTSTGGAADDPIAATGWAANELGGDAETPTLAAGTATPQGGVTKYLKLNPMPDHAGPITCNVKLEPPTFTIDDVCDDFDGNDFDDPLTPIPAAWPEATILAVARFKWLSHPRNVLDTGQRQAIATAYEDGLKANEGRVNASAPVKGNYCY